MATAAVAMVAAERVTETHGQMVKETLGAALAEAMTEGAAEESREASTLSVLVARLPPMAVAGAPRCVTWQPLAD